MKWIGRVFIFLLVSINLFCGTIKINKVRMNNTPAQLVFDISASSTPKYNTSYDEYNRLLFLEIPKGKMNTKFSDRPFVGKYIEKIDMIDYGNAVGFFITLKKNVGYKVYSLKSPYRIVIDLKSNVKKQFTVVIDPGHGGKDPGSIGFRKYREKDIVLSVGRLVREELGSEFNVIMTRSTDVFIPLAERSRIGNRAKADLFVSIHINSSTNSSSTGVETFYFSKKSSPYAEKIAAYENSFGEKYGEKTTSIAQIMGELAYNKNQEKSIGLARPVVNRLSQVNQMRNRGIHGANFAVLRGFNGPGILIELGFINNKKDVGKLLSKSRQRVMAKEIAKKIREYFY
ncbi:N-acetylmuramoyl-L-alanine amidase [Cetobacterium ceti]|uniref:N-acetylmuramoyl-L-alanine amidase n=1 Tax=Cetobacterium ceti TaxID=180163 RepID=A0A1T4NXK6_9FUSO|nr:N-acetylmuramoyl-L-alanine amidase [Cetobacterium ceti]SJZ83757.1 N-acetylmuramoyl-L-alanine amidase [Cetobacterium ceti]